MGQLEENVGIGVAGAKLAAHVRGDGLHLGVALGLAEDIVEVELAVLHDLDADVVERLDRRVAGQEVLRPRAEREDLELGQTENDAGDGHEADDHLGHFFGGSDGILGDMGPEFPQAHVVGVIEHAAVGVAPPVDEVLAGLLGGRRDHDRPAELLGQDGRRALGSEVAEVDDQGVDALPPEFLEGLEGVLFVLDDGRDPDDGQAGLAALRGDLELAFPGELDREAVAADGDDAQPHLGNVRHRSFSFFCP